MALCPSVSPVDKASFKRRVVGSIPTGGTYNKENKMVYKANRGWAYSHQCSDKRKHVEGPFPTEHDANVALRVHVEKCDD
jgi:hypothetical protein